MHRRTRSFFFAVLLAVPLLCTGCKRTQPGSGFVVMRAERQVSGSSKWPVAIDVSKVGTYPAETKSGAGYFYDDVLEYRVWLHPEKGAPPLNGEKDHFEAFAEYETAERYSTETKGSEAPLVLVRQLEWISEPKRGQFVPEKGLRITEWQVEWLKNGKRTDKTIQEFLKHPYEADPEPVG